jgi:hypothetical protein
MSEVVEVEPVEAEVVNPTKESCCRPDQQQKKDLCQPNIVGVWL